jgi:tRNA modification GTPase
VTIARDEPIVAIATPAGRGGIGVVRLSFGAWSGGPLVARFHQALFAKTLTLTPRYATLVTIENRDGVAIDRGLALAFVAPHSYTGEDVLELQVHGGPAVLQLLVSRCLDVAHDLDARPTMRLARPGEFTERAFLNDKLDLAQAEAVADLIEAGSEAAVLGAQASLAGRFSDEVHALVDMLTTLRALVEATLDFPEEEIDFLEASDARGRLAAIDIRFASLVERAKRGAVLREGLTVVLVGRPNVGKSSLLNALAEAEVAIVTPIAGTTRDRVEETIRLEGIALHVVDTAGIRSLSADDEADTVERIGIARTWDAVEHANVVLHVVDARERDEDLHPDDAAIVARVPAHAVRRTIVNKIDLVDGRARVDGEHLYVSATRGEGLELLRSALLEIAGWRPDGETPFIARERHLAALRTAGSHLDAARAHAALGDRQLEFFAEELRLAQDALSSITGAFTSDDLLGTIFGSFCIGK